MVVQVGSRLEERVSKFEVAVVGENWGNKREKESEEWEKFEFLLWVKGMQIISLVFVDEDLKELPCWECTASHKDARE